MYYPVGDSPGEDLGFAATDVDQGRHLMRPWTVNGGYWDTAVVVAQESLGDSGSAQLLTGQCLLLATAPLNSPSVDVNLLCEATRLEK